MGIPLEFGFPFYGETFTYSWMHSNGVISFLTTNGRPTLGGMCCNGGDLENTTHNYFSGLDYFIAPLWTDTININKDLDGDGINDNGFFVESYTDNQGNESQRYLWQNQSEYYNNQTNNTYRVELFDTGKIDMHHHEIDIRNHSIFVGIVGDQSADELDQLDYFANQTSNYTGLGSTSTNIYSEIPGDPCDSNPLYSTTCSGYQQAYYNQQCALDPLYDTGCSGYATAYYNQQCTLDPLYDSGCTGYEQAYYNQQCSLDPLYDSGCDGYEEAYFEYRCDQDALYDVRCTGYEQAYFDQQCLQNPQYDPLCTGYIEPVVATPTNNYSEPAVLDDPVVNDVVFSEPEVVVEVFQEPVFEPAVVEEPVASLPEPVVEEVPEPTTEEFENTLLEEFDEPVEEIEVAAVEESVEEIDEQETVEEEIEEQETVEEEIEESPQEETTDETEEREEESGGDVEESVDNTEESDSDSSEAQSDSNDKEDTKKDSKKSKRERLKKAIAKKATQLAEQMAEAATAEEQAALQAQILALIGFNPDFSGYGSNLPGGQFYIDPGLQDAKLPENKRGLRNGLAQQLLHKKMVDMQYK